MGKIRILDSETVSKIAAGEVIERPASVIKELVENSIDAGSSNIQIDLEDSGKRAIRVTDNGQGMDRDDIVLSCEKHATSKIGKIEDLDSISTLGFRGEALASICAVSKVEILTKPNDPKALVGTSLRIGEGLKELRDCGCPGGTTATVTDLFYNTPARLKYMKSARTELAHIVELVTNLALAHTNIRFRLTHNGEQLINTSGTGNLIDTIASIYGTTLAKNLMPLRFASGGLSVSGFIGKPSIAKGSADFISVFVNRRWVTSRTVVNALKDSYGTLLPKDRYPIAIVSIEIDPHKIDVNVHPTKRQIRFSDETELYNQLLVAFGNTLKLTSLEPRIDLQKKPESAAGGEQSLKRIGEPKKRIEQPGKEKGMLQTEIMERKEERRTEHASKLQARVVGQVEDLYIIAESTEGLVIVNQHAAHERILYERVKEGERGEQELLVPLNIELSQREKAVVEQYLDILSDLGFKIERFGKQSYIVRQVPVFGGMMETGETIHDIISDLISYGSVRGGGEALKERVYKVIACRTAVKAGERLEHGMMEKIVRDLYRCKQPYTCPHGRPTIVSLNKEELKKRFGRE